MSVKTQVGAPPAAVFAAASDFANAPQRIPAITRVEVLTPGPVGRGTRFRETRMMFKREHTEEMEVIAFDPPRSYTLGCTSCGCRYESVLAFTPKDGGTEVSMSFAAVPLTFLGKVMSFLFRPMMKSMVKVCAKDLDDLKRSIESSR